jgi:hypothetical protein
MTRLPFLVIHHAAGRGGVRVEGTGRQRTRDDGEHGDPQQAAAANQGAREMR